MKSNVVTYIGYLGLSIVCFEVVLDEVEGNEGTCTTNTCGTMDDGSNSARVLVDQRNELVYSLGNIRSGVVRPFSPLDVYKIVFTRAKQ